MKNIFSFLHKNKNSSKNNPGYVKFSSLVASDPFVDWVLIVICTILITGSLVGIGGYVYIKTQAELSSQGSVAINPSAASRFDTQKLKEVIDTFDARANERVMLTKGYNGPKDPSLP